MSAIPGIDIASLTWFIAVWIGYTWYADRGSRRVHSLRAVMFAHRHEWMQRMVERDNRIVDANIVGNLLQSVSFFASTTLLIMAGLMTLLGSTDTAIPLIRVLPFTSKMTLILWELKLLVLIIIFVYAFFKFTWALRQFNYCSVLIGAAPNTPSPNVNEVYVHRAAQVSTLASKDFNQGLRAFYFSLAALGWFINPWFFIGATTLVAGVLYWREFQSETLEMLALTGAK
jgi:uncharacterized membrane protein